MPHLVNRRAFTLVELLVVISIMATFAALAVVAAGAIRGNAKKRATEGILAACHQAIELHGAEKGGYPGAARHPAWWLRDNNEPVPGIAAVAGNAMAARRPAPVFADRRHPLTYGCPSSRATLLGSDLAMVTGLARDSLPEASEQYFGFILGFGNAIAELNRQKALHTAAVPYGTPHPPNLLPGSHDPAGAWGVHTLWSPEAPLLSAQSGSERWKPGRIRASFAPGGADTRWVEYRLLGTAIYDAWGREIFYFFDKQREAFGFLSAGADGCLVWDPGVDGELASAATATVPDPADPTRTIVVAAGSPFPGQPAGTPRREGGVFAGAAGDDRWGGRDNVFAGMQ